MRKQVPVETDELEDELELNDGELRKQIADGYLAYLCGETKDLDRLITQLRSDLNPQRG
jgi:23S rRNA C2498 (ribose-2'-O)-methylase RlmM